MKDNLQLRNDQRRRCEEKLKQKRDLDECDTSNTPKLYVWSNVKYSKDPNSGLAGI
jgi:hypothetical protein